MKTVNILKDDLSVKCKHCEYELGVHASRGGYCPADDPSKYKRNEQHKFDERSEFEEVEK